MKKHILILLAGCVAIGITGTIVMIASLAAAPSPAQRFKAFAEQAKRDAASTSSDPELFREYFYYDVVQTDSLISPYRATIRFYDEMKLWEYAYDFRGETWSCTGAVIRHPRDSSGPGKVEVLNADQLIEARFAEIFTAIEARGFNMAS